MKRSIFIALVVGALAGLGVQLAIAQPVDPLRPTFRNVTITGSQTMRNDSYLRFPGTSAGKYAFIMCDAQSVRVGGDCGGGTAHTLNFYATNGGNVQWSINGTTGNLEGTGDNGVTVPGTVFVTSLSGTAGSGTGYTTNSTGAVQHKIHSITVTRAALTAAATTEDETIWTVPAKTRVIRIIVDVTQAFDDAAGPISAVTIGCGPSAGSAAYVATSSVFTVNTIGDVAAEIGTGLTSATIADIPSFSGTTAISCRFTSTGGNLSTLTTGSATFYIEHLVYP